MLSRRLSQALTTAPRRSLANQIKSYKRFQSSKAKLPTPIGNPASNVIPEENVVQSTLFTFNVFHRFLKYTAVGLVAITITGWTVFEGAHLWVENVELAKETDQEVKKWQWDLEAERWTGGDRGGTDAALGFMGRHAVRSAWMAQEWGTGNGASVIGSNAFTGRGGSGAGGLSVVEARLEFAQDFITIALQAAERKAAGGKLRPQTALELLARHANVMERMGTRDALFEARMEYEKIWSQLPGRGIEAARIALKLGDVNQRIGDKEDALSWWGRAVALLEGGDPKLSANIPPTTPNTLPSAPLAQRTFISTLISLSAFYATTGQLRQAQALEESSLSLLRSIPQPPSLDASSPPHALHALYILHRSSLLSIHLAEVQYALRTKKANPLQWLQQAAESSERVALTLSGLPLVHPDAPESKIPHPPSSETPLVAAYAKSVTMRKPARSLLRDARRTAAEAWSLMGILSEETGAPNAMERALECYERALGWAGVAADRAGGIGTPGEGTLETEWKVLWGNYVRARDVVRKDLK